MLIDNLSHGDFFSEDKDADRARRVDPLSPGQFRRNGEICHEAPDPGVIATLRNLAENLGQRA
jgi:hypothetical protein